MSHNDNEQMDKNVDPIRLEILWRRLISIVPSSWIAGHHASRPVSESTRVPQV